MLKYNVYIYFSTSCRKFPRNPKIFPNFYIHVSHQKFSLGFLSSTSFSPWLDDNTLPLSFILSHHDVLYSCRKWSLGFLLLPTSRELKFHALSSACRFPTERSSRNLQVIVVLPLRSLIFVVRYPCGDYLVNNSFHHCLLYIIFNKCFINW